MLTQGERSGFSAQPLVRGWLVIFLDSGASAPWWSWPLPPSSMSCCLHVLPHRLLLGQGHPCFHGICGFHGLDGKAAGRSGPVLLTALRRLPSFSDSFLLRTLLLKAAIPRGPRAAPGEVWMGSHHTTSVVPTMRPCHRHPSEVPAGSLGHPQLPVPLSILHGPSPVALPSHWLDSGLISPSR